MMFQKCRVFGSSDYLSIFLKTDILFPTSLLVKQQIHCQCIFVFMYLILEQMRMLLFLFATQKEKLQLCTSRNGNGVQQNRVTSFLKEHVSHSRIRHYAGTYLQTPLRLPEFVPIGQWNRFKQTKVCHLTNPFA